MTKEEVKQRLLDRIAEQINFTLSAEEIKELAEAFKVISDIDHDDSRHKCNAHCKNCNKHDDDDGVVGFCD